MVLRRKTITAEHQEKVDYYANDESLSEEKDKTSYYSKDSEMAKGSAKWVGKLKNKLGLEDEIIRSEFKQISYGNHPITKERLKGQGKRVDSKERLFHDLCWSPNKSFSIAGLALGHTELIEAHKETIAEMCAYVEAKYGGYRDQSGDTTKDIKTGEMLFAVLTHYTTRPVKEDGEIFIDPGMHSHVLAMNTSQRKDGQWRALQHEDLSADKSLGFIYNQIYAEKVQALGFKIRQAKDGFELADISDDQIKVFSKRSQQAKKRLEAEGLEATPKAIHKKALRIRQGKIADLTLDDLKEQWAPQAEGFSITKHDRVERIGHGTAEEELQAAINHLSERSVNFHRSNIQQYVFKYVQNFSPADLEDAIAAHPALIELGDERYSTVEALKQEIAILDAWRSGIGAKEPLIESVSLDDLQQIYWVDGKKIQLNDSQATAIKNSLESDHQFQIIKGLAGVGKTTAIAEFISQLQKHGADVELFGFAGTHEAKTELEKSLNLQSRTVASLTTSGSEGRIWVVDEAGLNSNREWVEILAMAKKQDVRLIMLGDPGQNSSVEAGSPMASVINKFPETAQEMSKIIRQQNPDQLKAVELISSGRGAEAIKLLDEKGWLRQIADRGERAEAIAEAFTSLSVKDMDRTVLVSGTNIEREAINGAVRKKLKKQGILGDSTTIQALYSRNFSKQESKEVRNYKEGDWLKFHNVPREAFMKSGQLYKVTGIDGDKLKIETIGGRQYSITPSKFKGNIEVLYTKSIDIAVGDRARFTATIKANDWYNGKQFEITAVSGEWIEGTDKDGKKYRIDTLSPVGIDHDWVGTSYRRQGKTARNAIASQTNDLTSSREPTTVSISRQTHNIQIFAEDKDALIRLVQHSNRQENLLDELGNDDSSLAALKGAIADFEKHGGKARDYVSKAIKGKNAKTPKPTYDQGLIQQWTENYNRLLSRVQRQTVEQNLQELSNEYGNQEIAVGRDLRSSDREPRNIERSSYKAGDRGIAKTQRRGEQDTESSRRIDGVDREKDDSRATRPIEEARQTHSAAELADRIFAIRLSEQLAGPLAELRESFSKLSGITQSNELKRQEINERLHDLLLSKKDAVVDASLKDYRDAFLRVIEPPKKLDVWVPNYEGIERPSTVKQKHWVEMQGSAIHPDLIKLNIKSLTGMDVYSSLLEDYFTTLGSGQIRTTEMKRWLNRYECLGDGGWWGTAGINPQSLVGLQSGQKPEISTNGVFKGDNPRKDTEKSLRKGHEVFQKYENPKGRDRPFFLPNIPDWLAEKVYQKHNINPTEAERASGVWHIIHKYNLPITLIEGKKKTLASWSQGIPTIGTPGVTLYKANEKTADGRKIRLPKRELLDELKVFATLGRKITIAKDQDSDLNTRRNVTRDTIRSAEVLAEFNTDVHITQWHSSRGKGGDDVIAQSGPKVYVNAVNSAKSWEIDAQHHYASKYRTLSSFAQRKLGKDASQVAVDAIVWKEAIDRGDIYDGLRYLRHSEGFKQHGEDYIKTVAKESVKPQEKTSKHLPSLEEELEKNNELGLER